jgi:hypothetical protein
VKDLGFILGSWIVTIGGMATFAVAMFRRARRDATVVPPEERPWL